MLQLDKVCVTQSEFRLSASVQFMPGQIHAIMGPSGSGKSTLLSAIAGFAEINSGEIFWNDKSINDPRPAQRPVAMLFQDNNLFPHLTASQNVRLALSSSKHVTEKENAETHAALSRVGLGDYGTRRPATLSGGQQSRVALARVLLQDKPIVLMDEPFSALGPGQRHTMITLCREVLTSDDRCVLIVTHDPADAALADTICVVANGNVMAPGPSHEMLSNPPEVLRRYLGR